MGTGRILCRTVLLSGLVLHFAGLSGAATIGFDALVDGSGEYVESGLRIDHSNGTLARSEGDGNPAPALEHSTGFDPALDFFRLRAADGSAFSFTSFEASDPFNSGPGSYDVFTTDAAFEQLPPRDTSLQLIEFTGVTFVGSGDSWVEDGYELMHTSSGFLSAVAFGTDTVTCTGVGEVFVPMCPDGTSCGSDEDCLSSITEEILTDAVVASSTFAGPDGFVIRNQEGFEFALIAFDAVDPQGNGEARIVGVAAGGEETVFMVDPPREHLQTFIPPAEFGVFEEVRFEGNWVYDNIFVSAVVGLTPFERRAVVIATATIDQGNCDPVIVNFGQAFLPVNGTMQLELKRDGALPLSEASFVVPPSRITNRQQQQLSLGLGDCNALVSTSTSYTIGLELTQTSGPEFLVLEEDGSVTDNQSLGMELSVTELSMDMGVPGIVTPCSESAGPSSQGALVSTLSGTYEEGPPGTFQAILNPQASTISESFMLCFWQVDLEVDFFQMEIEAVEVPDRRIVSLPLAEGFFSQSPEAPIDDVHELHIRGDWQIDNIVVDTVPEPHAPLLGFAALLALAAISRARSSLP